MSDPATARGGLLAWIERVGNALPHPATLFLIGAVLVMAGSELAVRTEWTVSKTLTRETRVPVLDATGAPVVDPGSGAALTVAVADPAGGVLREPATETLRARSLLRSDGLYWAVQSLVENFKNFPPLAIVLVGMLGIGLADRSGLIGAALKATLLAVPPFLLTPTVFFVGVISSVALDAGYVVLPPIAAALYHAVGRSPLVGLAAVFAGVSAGFSANLMVTSLDVILAGFSEAGARLVDPTYAVAQTANLYFMIVSTFLLTAVGWAVTHFVVEPRFATTAPAAAPDDAETVTRLDPNERRGLVVAAVVAAVTLAVFVAATWIPGAPLHGMAGRFPRWVTAIVPLLFLGFFVPGLAYGLATGSLRSDRDVARVLSETMASMGPYIVLAFFAAQFVEYFRYSGLGEMLAIRGGGALARAELPAGALMIGFVGLVAVANLFIGSMSAKYAFFAPVFVPMFMQAGISPELTQAAYRVGDSVSNVITPLNPYVVIILVFMQRWAPKAGIGTLVALMLPYAAAFLVTWCALLLVWMALGVGLGPGGTGPLTYLPGS